MRRWLFAVLLLANIGLLMWATWYRETPDQGLQPRPLLHPELMVPLNTPGVALRARKNDRSAPPLAVVKPRPRCVSVGPFAGTSADQAAAWFGSEKVEAVRRVEETKIASSYWIHLAPFATRKDAERRKREIEKLGVRDVLIMQDPHGGIAISLGLYTQADNAGHRMRELAEKGVKAQQEIRYRTVVTSWFDLRLPEPADEAVARLRARNWGIAGVEVSDAPCAPDAPG
jgi:hypothetical protein